MNDSTSKIVKKVFNGELMIGDQDSIIFFAAKQQNNMKNYSAKIAEILLNSNSTIDDDISQILMQMKNFEKLTTKKKMPLMGNYFLQKDFMKSYEKVLEYIDKMTLQLCIEQAQIFKEIKLFEILLNNVIENSYEIEKCINEGESVLKKKNTMIDYTENERLWFSRLEKKIEDLKISHTLALQNQVQIKLLNKNHLILADKISSIIYNTFPVWCNQMAISLGIELEEKINVYNETCIKANKEYVTYIIKKIKNNKDIDFNKIKKLNYTFEEKINEMKTLKDEDLDIRKSIKTLLQG